MKKLLVILALMCLLTACGEKKDIEKESKATVESSVESSSTDDVATTATADVQYKIYRLIVNDSLTETDLPTQMTNNGGFIPDSLFETSVDIKCYIKDKKVIIAENTTDKLTAMNNITLDGDKATITYNDTAEKTRSLTVDTKTTDDGELYVVLTDESGNSLPNVAMIEITE